jgi:hypothetical protein
MKLFSTSRPSPAMVVAVFALVFAMVGSAVAANDGLSSKITKSKVKSISKKQADKELKANISGSHVNTADKATTATSADTATKASDSDALGGQPASAYQQPKGTAVVLRTPTVSFDPARALKGFTAVTRPSTGIFCLTPTAALSKTADTAIVTVEWDNSFGFDLLAFWSKSGVGCSPTQWAVRTYDFAAGGAPVLSDDVSFQITVIK